MHDAARVTLSPDLPLVEPHRLVAELLYGAQTMRHQQDRLAPPLELRELVEALQTKPFVADRKDLVDNQDGWIDVDGDGEAQSHIHPGRVGLHRGINERLEFRELDDLVETVCDLPPLVSPSITPLMKTFSRPEISG